MNQLSQQKRPTSRIGILQGRGIFRCEVILKTCKYSTTAKVLPVQHGGEASRLHCKLLQQGSSEFSNGNVRRGLK